MLLYCYTIKINHKEVGKLDLKEYVYCTNCKNFKIEKDDTPNCQYYDKCDIWDCEDSKSREERPFYEER